MALKFAVNNSLSAVTTLPTAIPTGALTLIQTQTASSSANISFTSGIDSTYDSYVFKFYNIHPATNNVNFEFNGSTDGGSNYNVTKTSSYIEVYHDEADTDTALQYSSAHDLAQSTSFQRLVTGIGNDNDQGNSGTLTIYNPSSTTFVKHFISNMNRTYHGDFTGQDLVAGYFNTTNALNSFQFKMSSGNTDSGTIKMYGVK